MCEVSFKDQWNLQQTVVEHGNGSLGSLDESKFVNKLRLYTTPESNTTRLNYISKTAPSTNWVTGEGLRPCAFHDGT
jgi:hypothetical protein